MCRCALWEDLPGIVSEPHAPVAALARAMLRLTAFIGQDAARSGWKDRLAGLSLTQCKARRSQMRRHHVATELTAVNRAPPRMSDSTIASMLSAAVPAFRASTRR